MLLDLSYRVAATASREKLTSEQLRITNHSFQRGQTVKVIALAGLYSHVYIYIIIIVLIV